MCGAMVPRFQAHLDTIGYHSIFGAKAPDEQMVFVH